MEIATPCPDAGPESVAFELWTRLRGAWSFPLLVAFLFAMAGWAYLAIAAFALAVAWAAFTDLRAKYWYRRWRRSLTR